MIAPCIICVALLNILVENTLRLCVVSCLSTALLMGGAAACICHKCCTRKQLIAAVVVAASTRPVILPDVPLELFAAAVVRHQARRAKSVPPPDASGEPTAHPQDGQHVAGSADPRVGQIATPGRADAPSNPGGGGDAMRNHNVEHGGMEAEDDFAECDGYTPLKPVAIGSIKSTTKVPGVGVELVGLEHSGIEAEPYLLFDAVRKLGGPAAVRTGASQTR